MNKDELQALYRQIRLRMTKGEVSSKSRMVGRRLLNEIDWGVYRYICAFEPIDSLNEVDIKGVVSRLKSQGIKVKLLSPAKTAPAPNEKFDLILVPCLAFDEDRQRLGWGGGWYDRFLAGQPQALKIGVTYQNGFIESGLPGEPHDIKLDMIITESGIY